MLDLNQVTPELITKYNVVGPRYTSYPTVPNWESGSFSTEYKRYLNNQGNSYKDLSLYIHLPFCSRLCTFCGCNKFITNNEDIYKKADTYSDHGHSHVGSNRGMEPHPYLGFNYRIGELNAAVGLAQMRKIEQLVSGKRKNKKIIKDKLRGIDGLTFRHMPDEEGDSGTFLNFFLSDTATAQLMVDKLAEAGVGGVNYWFTNMYHFINQWDHVKNLISAAPLAIHHLGAPQDYNNLQLPKSQDVVGRLLSLGIRATWTDEEASKIGDDIARVVNSVLA